MCTPTSQPDLISLDQIKGRILVLRGHRVLLDSDIANFYGIPTGRLNQTMGLKARWFPSDLRFQLTPDELRSNSSHPVMRMRPQITTPYLPWAFTELGVIMAATVLTSPRAIQMDLVIVRSFVGLRHLAVGHRALERMLAGVETEAGAHDEQLGAIGEALRQLAAPIKPKRR
jgi:hypothetical protein